MNGHGRSQSAHLPRSPGDGQVINPFDSEPAAQRYAGARPFYHAVALELAMSRLGLGRVPLAVDLGCGTGLSSRALREWADHVIALDASAAMLAAAEPLDGVRYAMARSEQLPLPGSVAALATAGAAFHWFDQARTLAELARVLQVGAGLVVYGGLHRVAAGQLSAGLSQPRAARLFRRPRGRGGRVRPAGLRRGSAADPADL
jgi:SAM-dependent methyltransferase